MSESPTWSVSERANECISSVVSGVSEVASNVTQGVGAVVHEVTSGMGEVAHSVSTGVGGTVHQITGGMTRLLTAPPDLPGDQEEEDEDLVVVESPGVLPPTPRNTTLSPTSHDCPFTDRSPGTESERGEEAAINSELGLTEDHFSEPEESVLSLSVEEVEASMEKVKSLILQCEESTTRRRALVHKLIQLRLRLQEIEEVREVQTTGVVFHMSHQLQPQKPPLTRTTKQYCDKCAQIIWGVIHVSYVCALCEYQCHGRCVQGIQRRCASVRVADDTSYILHICPEVGLAAQNYRCGECRRLITNKYTVFSKSGKKLRCQETAWSEPRRCDYTGLYFCPACHWNSRMVMPARVIHNWDFEEQCVSRQAKQLLLLMRNKSVLHLEKLNPHLFKFVEELCTVKKLREDLITMKQYLGTCRTAQGARMLRQLEERQHFVENAHMYSLQDLIDINSGVLVEYLRRVHDSFSLHIKKECLVCQGKGFICEICDVSDIIFPFDGGVVVCGGCCTVLHRHCHASRGAGCPRCARHQARRKGDSTTLSSP